MSCEVKSSNINKTFILEPLSITGGNPTLSACTGMYTDKIISCTGDSELSLSNNRFEFNGIISTPGYIPIVESLTDISGLEWYNRLSNGELIVVGTSGNTKTYLLKDKNNFDNPSGWELYTNESRSFIEITSTGSTISNIIPEESFNPQDVKLFLNGVLENYLLDYTISGRDINWVNTLYNLDIGDEIKIII